MSQERNEQPNPATLSNSTCRRLSRGGALCAVVVLAAACSAETREGGLEGTGGSAGSGGVGGSGGTGAGSSGAAGSAGNGGSAGQGGAAGDGGTAGIGAAGGTGGTSGSGGVGGSAGSAGTSGSGGTAGTGGTGGTGGNPCGNSDPDCECDGTAVVAKDGDNDSHGSKDCNANPGDDCDDNDTSFFQNACGGCTKNIGGAPGANCNECGVLQCSGMNAVQCVSPNPAPKRCGNATTPETCVGGSWVAGAQCSGSNPACLNGSCVQCIPGTFRCITFANGQDTAPQKCLPNGTYESSYAGTCFLSSQRRCNAATGTCVHTFFRARDHSLTIPSAIGVDVNAIERGIPTQEVLDRATGFDFG